MGQKQVGFLCLIYSSKMNATRILQRRIWKNSIKMALDEQKGGFYE
jgi:hypothetical protein